jgi:prolyl-tRNA synthetase
MRTVYAKVFSRMGLDAKVVQASGGTFSKYSHEFQVITPAGEDLIFHCPCGFAVNKEIAEVGEGDACPDCGKPIVMSKSIEVGNIFQLNTKFSEPFNLTYATETGEQKIIYMGCYGIGLTRLLGTVVEVMADEKGMIWPEAVAPYQFHIVPLFGKDEAANAAVEASVKELIDVLKKSGQEALIDDRRDVGAGEKFADSDLIGIPHRIVVSAKTIAAGSFEVKHRANGTVQSLDIAAITKFVTQ